MNKIIIKTQKEFDDLPKGFDEYTVVEIRSETKVYVRYKIINSSVVARGNSSVVARDNSSVEAWDNSSVVARDNSSVEARDNSSVELFLFAYVIVLWSSVRIKKALDHSTVIFKGCKDNVEERSETACIREVPGNVDISFDEWLRRGYVYADGITKKLVSQKTINDITVFEVSDFPKKTTSFVVKRGDVFSHGETVEKAIKDLRYKISDRDTSEFEHWKDNHDLSIAADDAIAAYRTITGACEFGTKGFVESIKVPEKLTPMLVAKLTHGQFGNVQFRKFIGLESEGE